MNRIGGARPWVVAVVYLAVWEALTRLSPVTAAAFYLPAAAVSVYMLMRFGIGYAPLIIVAEVLHRVLFPGPEFSHLPVLAVVRLAAVKATVCACGIATIRYVFHVSPSLRTSRDLALFFIIAGNAAPYIIALYTTSLFVANGIYAPRIFDPTFQGIWLAYSTGIITGYPLLVYFVEPIVLGYRVGITKLIQRVPMLTRWNTTEVIAQYILLAGLLFYSLHAYLSEKHVNAAYLALPLLPLGWIAVRRGLFAAGFACSAVVVATAVYVRLTESHMYADFVKGPPAASNVELQYFMLVNSLITFALATLSSERADAERRLDRTEFALEQARESSLLMSAEVNTAGVLHNASRQLRKVFGIDKQQIHKRSLLDLVHDEDRGVVENALSLATVSSNGIERRVRMKNAPGQWRWIDLVLTGGASSRGKVEWIVAFLRDITNQKRAEEALARSAYYDHLTELPNRRHLEESLRESIVREKREGATLALLYIDLDKFKPVNDTYGHAAGDRVLVEVARRLRRCIRQSDIVARLGGDEFAVVLQDIHPVSQSGIPIAAGTAASDRAAVILSELQAPISLGKVNVQIDASIGITIFGDEAPDIESLLRTGDAAMYQAKQAGSGQIALFSRVAQEVAK